jgi:hypothetical protein
MGKNIKNGFDEVEIIQRRDGAVDAKFVEPLSAHGRRALADARLLALALTLPAGQDAGKTGRGADDPDDAELLAYLLDELPDPRHNKLERAIRGNAHTIGSLMRLRTALNPVADERDLHRAELRARNIVRRTVQALEVREVGRKLEFRERQPQLRPGPKTGAMLSELLDRANAPILGSDLDKEARHLLSRWKELTRPAKQPKADIVADSELRQVGARLADLLLELQESSDQLAREIRHTVYATVDAVLPRDLRSRADLASDAPLFQAKLPGLGAPEDSLSEWSGTKEIQAGAWSLLIEGSATPSPILSVTVRRSDPDGMPDLTLVQRNRGFETAKVSSAGIAPYVYLLGTVCCSPKGRRKSGKSP